MSEAASQHSLEATLELPDSAVLGGRLILSAADTLSLGPVRLLQKPASGNKVRIPAGARGTLRSEGVSSTLEVIVTGVSGREVDLSFATENGQVVDDWRAALSTDTPLAPQEPATDSAGFAGFEELSLRQLDMMIQKFLLELTTHLFDLSTSSRQVSSGHDTYYEAMNAVKSKGNLISSDFLGTIRGHFAEIVGNGSASASQAVPDSPDSLNLVDLRDFEDHLAIARMVKIGEEMHQVDLESLIFRTAEMIDARPTDIRLPIHVAQLCAAFRQAIDGKGIPKEAMKAIFDFFVSHFIRKLDSYYRPLNVALESQGIRPGIEDEIRSRGSLLKTGSAARPEAREAEPEQATAVREEPEAAPEAPPGQNLAEQVPDVEDDTLLGQAARLTGSEAAPERPKPAAVSPAPAGAAKPAGARAEAGSGQAKYQSVINALNALRDPEALAPGSTLGTAPAAGAGEALAPAGLAKALDDLQAQPDVRQAVAQAGSLRAYIAENREQIGGLGQDSELSADSLNQLDLVDNLFGTLQSRTDVAQDVQPSLGALQIPLAKLALREPEFFANREHAAREVIDKLASLAGSANFPNPALEGRISNIVDQIVENYEQDSAVFEQALDRVERLLKQQQRAAERNRERVVSAQEGQDKLDRARQNVEQAINERLQAAEVPRELLDLIDNGLREAMVLTQLRQGADSAAWQEQLASLDRLAGWLQDEDAGDQERARHAEQAEALLASLGEDISTASPTGPDPAPVLDRLQQIIAGEATPEMVAVEAPAVEQRDPAELREKIDELPRLRRWIRRVEELEDGTWLSYRDKEGKAKRMQLAWSSPARDRFIFVNERGQKQADLSAVQLARQLSRGMSPPGTADDLSLVDQSMYSTLENVQQTLSFARNHDSLTRLINRDTLLDQMRRALRHAQRRQSEHGALYLDVDQFQLVNQVYGREAGDQILAEFGKLLAQLHGSKSSSARIDGDAFGILLLDRPLQDSLRYADKIREDIAASSVDIDGDPVSFTVSIGAAPLKEHSDSVENVLENARTAMRVAKDEGRNRVVEFTQDRAEVEREIESRAESRQELELALASERFSLRAQPIVRNSVDGSQPNNDYYELLLSVNDKDGEELPLRTFIESAENYGFMTLVDRWVVREAFQWIHRLMDDQKEVPRLAINLSGASITDDEFLDYLLEQISEFGVGTSQLCFEITEAGTITNLVKAADFIRTFRNIGCKFSIDDFGTGLSSHNLLRDLPVDYVKIDGSFIADLPGNRSNLAMVQSINDMAHFLGQKTIAEAVENEQALDILRELQVDYVQGWALSRPKPLAEVADQLSGLHS